MGNLITMLLLLATQVVKIQNISSILNVLLKVKTKIIIYVKCYFLCCALNNTSCTLSFKLHTFHCKSKTALLKLRKILDEKKNAHTGSIHT